MEVVVVKMGKKKEDEDEKGIYSTQKSVTGRC